MPDEQTLRKHVRQLMLDNATQGYSKLRKAHYCYIMPSPKKYPYQWFWDTCFHVFILCALGELKLARDNLESLFTMQQRDGFVGHMIFWKGKVRVHLANILQSRPTWGQLRPHMSSLIQPTLVAQALLRYYERSGDKEFLIAMIPKIKAYHVWLSQNRDVHKDGLISIISPFESGLDYKASYDPLLGHQGQGDFHLMMKTRLVGWRNFFNGYNLRKIFRQDYFQVKDVLVNSIYVCDLLALARLCETVGQKQEARRYISVAAKTTKSILELMYDEPTKAFYDIYGKDNKKLKVLTFTAFFPLLLDQIPQEVATEVIRTHLFNKKEFALPFPIPSLAKNQVGFNPYPSKFLWRGPTWIVGNWFLYRCLREKGYTEEAQRLRQTILDLIDQSGFREYYNPFTGAGGGAENFTWSGLIVDIL